MANLLYQLFKIILLLVLPFAFLIRGAVYFHHYQSFSPWIAIAGGVMVTTVLLFIYMTFFYGRLTGKLGDSGSLKRRSFFALIIVLGYSLYGLVFLSDSNVKHPEVRKEYTSLHPILRLSISTIVFLDEGLILTDAKRQPEDYKKMGLKSKKRSLHYPQNDGYVHAIDIRTNGRSEIRNFFLKTYFQLMGLNTLRHVGTGDHLHVSLHSHDSPGAI